jgi:hypothetical protein
MLDDELDERILGPGRGRPSEDPSIVWWCMKFGLGLGLKVGFMFIEVGVRDKGEG